MTSAVLAGSWPIEVANDAGPRVQLLLSWTPGRTSRSRLDGETPQDLRLARLMVAAQGGDPDAYRTLLRACVPRIAAVARRVGVRDEAVDDVIQEVLVAVDRARASYDPARRFLPWLHAIAQRRAIDNLRQNGRRTSREVHDEEAFMAFPDGARGAVEEVERRQDREGLLAAVATLPPRQREAVQRLALAEESLEEASRATGRSKVALKVNLHRGIHALRAKLAAGTFRDG